MPQTPRPPLTWALPPPRPQLGNDGSVPFRHGERVDFKYIITHK